MTMKSPGRGKAVRIWVAKETDSNAVILSDHPLRKHISKETGAITWSNENHDYIFPSVFPIFVDEGEQKRFLIKEDK
mgnify:FL=1